MKNLFVLLLLLPFFTNAQDQIITTENDTINCRIKRIDGRIMYYSILIDGKFKTAKIGMFRVLSHSWDDTDAEARLLSGRSVGDELVIARNHWFIGAGLNIVGTVVLATSFKVNNPNTHIVIGSVLSIVGYAFIMESWSHIGNAGLLMNNRKIGLSFNNGIGLRYRI